MMSPDLQFMVHSAEVTDDDGKTHQGSKITQIYQGSEPPIYELRDFAFAAFSKSTDPSLRLVHFGRKELWAFASPHENCEEVAIFRKGSDVRRKWDEEAMQEPQVGLDKFFVMRLRQVTDETPLSKTFNGEWGFWESFFVPIVDDERTMQALSAMDSAACEKYFAPRRLPVTVHKCPEGKESLAIPDDMVVKYEVKASCSEEDLWIDLCNKVGEDMIVQEPWIIDNIVVKPGSEVIRAHSEMSGTIDRKEMKKRNFEQMKLPIEITFEVDMHVSAEWRPDLLHLQHKFDSLGEMYHTNLLGGWSTISKNRADPWHPMARLTVNALNKILARYPDIHSLLDVGCGDMAWMQYFLKDHPKITYIGVDILPFCLGINLRRFPKMQFINTDLSSTTGIEVMPQGCDLILAKEVFNHMALPDAVEALKRVVKTRPRFLLTHVDLKTDNTGWEKRISQHREYTAYDYNKSPFSMPYPVMEVQRISDDACFVLYQIMPDLQDSVLKPPPVVATGIPPLPEDLEDYITIAEGEWHEPKEIEVLPAPAPGPCEDSDDEEEGDDVPTIAADELGPRPVTEDKKDMASVAGDTASVATDIRPIKGVPAAEFRARCNLIFEKFDKDSDNVLNFEELVALMDAGGRRIEEYEAYAGLCKRLGCDARVGLTRKDVYKLFEKAPQAVWEEVYRCINPLAQLVKKGAEKLPETFLERGLHEFLFDDDEFVAKIHIDLNDHIFFGAAEGITEDHVCAFFGKQRMEVHIVAPGSFGAKDLFLWRLAVTPLTGEIVPEDCTMVLKDTEDRASIKGKKVTIKLVKSKKKKWAKVGTAATGMTV